MKDSAKRIVLVPRYTTVAGPGPFYSKPLNVRAFSNFDIVAWRSRPRGTVTAVDVKIEVSSDLVTWDTHATLSPSHSSEDTAAGEFDREWMRVRTDLTTSGDGLITYWVVGEFQYRHA